MKAFREEKKPTKVVDLLGLVSFNPTFINTCKTITISVLKPYMPPAATEYNQIVEDAIGDVRVYSLKWATNVDKNDERQAEVLATYKTDKCIVSRYLYIGVKRIAFSKRRRWMHNEEKGQYGYAARVIQGSDDARSQETWLEQKQASQILFDNELDLVNTSTDPIAHLTSKGIPPETIEIIIEKISGVSYAEIARERGGTEDKYRKLVKRALNSIGLDINLDQLSPVNN